MGEGGSEREEGRDSTDLLSSSFTLCHSCVRTCMARL